MNQEPVAHQPCPICGYLLPDIRTADVRCPECGEHIDKHMLVWHLHDRYGGGAQLIAVVFLLTLWYLTGREHGFHRDDVWFVGLLLVLAIRPLYRVIVRRGATATLIISRQGIHLRRSGAENSAFIWNDIREAKHHWVRGHLRILARNGKTLLKLLEGELGGRWRTRDCVRAINRLRNLYIAGDGDDDMVVSPRGADDSLTTDDAAAHGGRTAHHGR